MPKKQMKSAGKKAGSTFKSIMGDRKKLAVILTLLIATSGVIVLLSIPIPDTLEQQSLNEMVMGTVDCSITLDSKPLTSTTDGYAPIYDGEVAANNPFFIGDQEVTAMDFMINIVAIGNYVDWSTLSIDISASCNGVVFGTKTVPETPLDAAAPGFNQVVTFRITDFDNFVDPENPDSELTDGTLIYDLNCIALADGSINDAKGNDLSDTVSITQIWTVNSLPDGSFSMVGSEELVKPIFNSAPQNTRIEQGEYLPLYWVVYDDNPTTYTIKTYTTGDGSHIVEQGEWNPGDTIDYLAAGSYASIEPGDIALYVSCTIFDANGQQAIHSVLIEILVPEIDLAPTFEKADGPYTAPSAGDVEVFITFKPRSSYPNSYIIYQNSDEISRGAWDGSDILVFVDFLYAGANDIKCVVIDTYSRSSFYVHTVLTPILDEDNPDRLLDIDTGDPDANILNAPFSLGEIQGISLFVAIFFVGAGAGLWFIMKRTGK